MKLSRCLATASALLVGSAALAQDVTIVYSGVVTNVPGSGFTPPALAPLQPGDLLVLNETRVIPARELPATRLMGLLKDLRLAGVKQLVLVTERAS